MNEIVVTCNPFDLIQYVTVIKDGYIDKQIQTTMDRLIDTTKGLRSEYTVDKITLCGPKDYLENYQARMLLEFNNTCEIVIKEN